MTILQIRDSYRSIAPVEIGMFVDVLYPQPDGGKSFLHFHQTKVISIHGPGMDRAFRLDDGVKFVVQSLPERVSPAGSRRPTRVARHRQNLFDERRQRR